MNGVGLRKNDFPTLKKSLSDFFRRRQHPIKLVSYTSSNIWLMIIPLGKYLIASKFDFQSWIKANWLDILVITGIFAFALIKWIFVYYEIEEDGIVAHSGFMGIMTTKVYFSEITTFSCTQGYIYNAVNACTMFVETNAATVPRTDIKLVLSEKCVNEIYRIVTRKNESLPKFSISPKKTYLLIFSLLFSSAVSGMLLFGTFTFELYQLVGKELETRIFKKVNGGITRIDSKLLRLSNTVPRSILIVGAVILGGWLLSFTVNLMRHWSFTATRQGDQYIIESGIITKRRHVINRSKINFIDFQQTLLMKLFKISSVTLYCTGYGKKRREISALIPITTLREMNASLRILDPNTPRPRTEICTGKKDLARFILMPVLLCFLPSVAGSAAKLIVDRWHTEINILMTVGMIPAIWLVIVQVNAAFSTAIGFRREHCTLSYCKGYQFHKIVIHKRNISKIQVSRNIFQKINGTCTLLVCTNAETRKYHRLSSLPFDRVRDLLLREGYMIEEI